MPDAGTSLYYMAPIQNAPYIAAVGILSYNRRHTIRRLNQVTVSIADPFVNSRRHEMSIWGRPLHDFVPLYWAAHTPMQYVVTMKTSRLRQDELVFFVFDATAILQLPGVLTTDGNAASSQTTFYQGAGAVSHLNWKILRTPNCFSKEYKWRKCAEVLVPDWIPAEYIRRVCVYDRETATSLQAAMRLVGDALPRDFRAGSPTVIVERSLYY